MFTGSFLRVCRILRFVKKLDFSFLSLGGSRHGARIWCLGRVPKHRNQWQEVGGLLFSPQNSQLVHILSFHSQAMVSLFIFPTGPTALDSEPRGRRYVKNMGHDRNRLYSRAIHSPTCMEMHYVQWFLLKSVKDITVCEKIRFSLLESRWTKAWCPGLVSGPSAKAQELGARSRGLFIQPPKLAAGAYFEVQFLGCGFLIHPSNRSDSPRF